MNSQADKHGDGHPLNLQTGQGCEPRLLDQVRSRLRVKHYSSRTEEASTYWVRRFIRANGMRHPRELGGVVVEQFLTRLATVEGVAPSTACSSPSIA